MARRIILILISVLLLTSAVYLSGLNNLIDSLGNFPPSRLPILVSLFLLNLFLVSFRFWRILEHFGINLSWSLALRANISGNFASLFMIALLGHVAGRQTILRRLRIDPILIASISGYERILTALISFIFCAIGSVYYFGGDAARQFIEKTSLLQIVVVILASIFLSFIFGKSVIEKNIFRRIFTTGNFYRTLEIIGITLIAQTLVIVSFAIAILTISPEAGFLYAASAGAIISFAATLPIVINGWGVREFTAIYILGILNIQPSDAVAASVVIAVCATIAILMLFPLVIKKHSNENTVYHIDDSDNSSISIVKIASWLLAITTGVCIFFQVHIEILDGKINVNLADPFAILSLAAVALGILYNKKIPEWKHKYINHYIVVISSILILGFIHGWLEIGVTQWALMGRGFGWLVILGYFSAGYMMVSNIGHHGLRRLFEFMVNTACVIILFQIIARLVESRVIYTGINLTENFEGYAANRNAFAFQLLVMFSLMLGYAFVYYKTAIQKGNSLSTAFIVKSSIIVVGLFFCASRAGWITGVLLLVLASSLGFISLKKSVSIILVSLLIISTIYLIDNIDFRWGEEISSASSLSIKKDNFTVESSDTERWMSYSKALKLWSEYPVFGAGLGVFINNSTQWSDAPVVVHNTLLWILSELGIISAIIFVGIFFALLVHSWRHRKYQPYARILLLMLFSFSVFSLVHEIFYQRIFWFLLGAILAQPYSGQHHVLNRQDKTAFPTVS